jgi:hypothetical protein
MRGIGRPMVVAVGALSAVVVAQAASAVPTEGPFGLYMGEPLAALGPVEKLNGSGYHVLSPPRANAAIRTVIAEVFPDTGICMIMGQAPFADDPKGQKAIQTADSLAETLKAKYGAFKKLDSCNGDSRSCADNWLEEANEQSAQYAYTWDFKDVARPDKIGEIDVQVHALNAVDSVVVLNYFSAERKACEDAERAFRAGSL